MKKSIVALLAASAVVALTGAGASAVGDFTLKAKNEVVAGSNVTVSASHAKAGCDINVKVKDQTPEQNNTPEDTDWDNWDYTNNTVALGNIKLGTKTAGSTTIKAPAKAGYYELTGIVKLTKLSCVPVAGTTVTQNFNVGTPVYVDEVEGRQVEVESLVLGTYNYQLAGQVRTANNANKLKAGVGVELWVTNIDESRWVKIKTTKTNVVGEFKFEGVYDYDAHYDYDFQIRIVRDAKFFGGYAGGPVVTWTDDFYGFHDNRTPGN